MAGIPYHISYPTEVSGNDSLKRNRKNGLLPTELSIKLKIMKKKFNGIIQLASIKYCVCRTLAYGERASGDRTEIITHSTAELTSTSHHFAQALYGVFSKINLVRAYNQVPVAEEDKPKTVITTVLGLYEFPFMTQCQRSVEFWTYGMPTSMTYWLVPSFAFISELCSKG